MAIVIPQVEQEKDIFEVKIRFRDLTISKNEIVSALGYADGAIPVHFEEMIDDILSQLPKYCEIQAGYRLLDVAKQEERNDGLCVGGKFFKLQKIVASQLRKSEKAALFVSTIGPAIETWAKKLSADGDVALSYVVDTVASVTEEQTTDVLHDHIGKQMQMQGLNITNRYSPGYCDWSCVRTASAVFILSSQFLRNYFDRIRINGADKICQRDYRYWENNSKS